MSDDENKNTQGDVSVRQVQFRRLLDEENVLRVSFKLEHGQVDAFAVQLECSFSDGNGRLSSDMIRPMDSLIGIKCILGNL